MPSIFLNADVDERHDTRRQFQVMLGRARYTM